MSDLAAITLSEDNYDPNAGVPWSDEGDAGLHVTFYQHPVDGQDHVKIEYPADDKTVGDFFATDHYKRRFKPQWRVYKGELEEFAGQCRIETVSWIDPGLLHDMKRANIHTVEQLAALSDSSIDSTNMLGLMAFRAKAQEHLAQQEKSSQYDKLAAQNGELMKRLEATHRWGRRSAPDAGEAGEQAPEQEKQHH